MIRVIKENLDSCKAHHYLMKLQDYLDSFYLEQELSPAISDVSANFIVFP